MTPLNFTRMVRAVMKIDYGTVKTVERLAALCVVSSFSPRPTEAARLLDVKPATFSRMLSSLEDDGLVKVYKDMLDNRAFTLALTRKGNTALRTALDNYNEGVDGVLKR